MSRDAERSAMVEQQLRARGIADARVLAAMEAVPRDRFVPEASRAQAYSDRPLTIGFDATISQPYIVALMTELAGVKSGSRVLDVGTGSGYQAAVLVELGAEVFGVELVDDLGTFARANLRACGYEVDVVTGDGHAGRPEHAPYDAIVCAAAAEELPPALLEQMAIGGRLVIPIGPSRDGSVLQVVTRTRSGYETEDSLGVRFVPLRRDA